MEENELHKGPEERDDFGDQTASRCEHCGCETREDVVKAAFWGEGGLVAIEGIPARVCEGCGEQFYDDETTRKIEKVVAGEGVKAKREVLVPVFSLTDVEVP